MMSEAIEQYRALRERIDRRSGRLVDMHCKHITCKAGCADCCTDLTVFPVEYVAILEELRGAGVRELPAGSEGAGCAFLREGLCVLYRFRPLICRTHGLPVAFLEESEGEAQMSVSFCPKNFVGAEGVEFGEANTLDLEEMNGELVWVNERFLEERGGTGVGPRRVSLRQLREDLGRE